MSEKTDVRLEHALVDVQDLPRSIEFYRKILPGWKVRWEGTTSEGHRWVHFAPEGEERAAYLSLYETPDLKPAAGDDSESVRVEHVGFSHPDVDGLVKSLAPQGIRPSDRIDDGKYRRAYFLDPDGHQLEFVQKVI